MEVTSYSISIILGVCGEHQNYSPKGHSILKAHVQPADRVYWEHDQLIEQFLMSRLNTGKPDHVLLHYNYIIPRKNLVL